MIRGCWIATDEGFSLPTHVSDEQPECVGHEPLASRCIIPIDIKPPLAAPIMDVLPRAEASRNLIRVLLRVTGCDSRSYALDFDSPALRPQLHVNG
ncbi:hypothetical protein ACQRIU_003841 [Beauveria bassiana]